MQNEVDTLLEKLRDNKISVSYLEKKLRDLTFVEKNNLAKFYLAKLLSRTTYNKEEAYIYFEELLALDPENPDYLLEYAMLLKDMKVYDKAEKIFLSLIDRRVNVFLACKNLVYLYVSTSMYDKAYKIISLIDTSSLELSNIKFFLEYKLGLVKNYDYNKLTYTQKQIVKYSYKLAISHIARHQYEDDKKIRHSLFIEGIDIKALYFDLNQIIEGLEPENDGWSDYYILDMSKVIGREKDEYTSYLKVSTVAGTKNIISIHPIVLRQVKINKSFYRGRKLKEA